MFSSGSFMVSGLRFKSFIHFELTFVYKYRSDFILLHVNIQFFQFSLLKRLAFYIIYSLYISQKLVYCICLELSLDSLFCSIFLSIMPKLYCFDYYRFVIQFEIRNGMLTALLFLLKIHDSGSLKFHTDFRILLSISVKNVIVPTSLVKQTQRSPKICNSCDTLNLSTSLFAFVALTSTLNVCHIPDGS